MKVTQEKLPASQIGLEIEISSETSKNTYEKVVQNLARSTNIPGFRKGKVPRQVLLQRLGQQRIKATALEEIIQKSLEEAIEQESIESLGNLKLSSNFEELLDQYKPGEPLTFSATVDVPPSVALGQYQDFSIKAEETLYDPQELEDFLEQRRVQQATLVPVEERSAQMGDIAVVDYQGRFEADKDDPEKVISGVQGKDFQVEMSEGRFVKGMVEGIVGMNPEETKEISVTFPEDYQREDLAGQTVIFTITLKELKTKELPELDDDFAEEVSEFETMAEFRESLADQFREKAANATKNSIHEAIIGELVKHNSVDLPEIMIDKEIDTILTQTVMQMQQMGVDPRQLFTAENIPRMRQNARPEAVQRLTQLLIIKEIAKVESITPEAATIEIKIKEIKEQLSNQEIDEDKLQKMVEEDVLAEKTLNWLQEKTTVELVPQGSLNKSETEEAEVIEAEVKTEEE